MCGRAKTPDEFSEIRIKLNLPDLELPKESPAPNYNAAPGQLLPVIRRNPKTGARALDYLMWGLIPHWTTDPNPSVKPINATAERVAAAPMFKEAYAKRRCIVVMDGFYEWQAVPNQKRRQPFYITAKDRKPFGVAGIWENWKHPASGEWIRTFAIITTKPNELCAAIHNRMPVILLREDFDRWLGEEPDPRDLLAPYPAELMEAWPVSTRVNTPVNNDATLILPL